MTSVLNHQLRLSGNSLLFLAAFLLIGCGSLKNTSRAQNKHEPILVKPDSFVQEDTLKNGEVVTNDFLDSMDLLFPVLQKDTYQIAYFLPLFSNGYPELSSGNKTLADISLSFWWGSKIAFDTLQQIGLNAQVHVFDTQNDTNIINKQKSALIKNDIDLILGPFFSKNIACLARLSKKNKINIIAPLAQLADSISHNRLIFSDPASEVKNQHCAKLLNQQHPKNHPIILYTSNSSEDIKEAENFKKLLSLECQKRATIRTIANDYVAKGSLSKNFRDTNIVVIFSDKEGFVNSILSEVRRSLKTFYIYGQEKWLKFNSLDAQVNSNLHVHIVSGRFYDYELELTKRFVTLYREKYHTEPDEFALLGFCETLQYLTYLKHFGRNFQRFFNQISLPLPNGGYKLVENEKSGSFKNEKVQVVYFKDNALHIRK